MGIRQYWLIIWRRLWIPGVLLVILAGVSLLTRQTPASTYSTSMRFTVRVQPQTGSEEAYRYDGFYELQASEYIADDLSLVVSSQAFAADVNRHLAEMGSGVQIPPGSIGGVTFGGKQHRIIRLDLSWSDAAQLTEIAQAVMTAMEQDSTKYLDTPGAPGTLIQVIDEPGSPVATPQSLTQRLQLPVRLILALVVGIGLTFVLDYLDHSIRDKAELEAMGIAVLGEVPRR